MKRREFFARGLPSIVFSGVLANGCQPKPPVEHTPPLAGRYNDFPLNELTIEALAAKMQSGEYTARRLTDLYLERIDRIDRGDIGLNAVIEINPDALSIADELDVERRSGNVRGLLHGIPFLLKDNVDTGDRMMTTAGSLALSGHHASLDAPLVRQLRDAGAVLLGKTNLSEWANFRSWRSSSGWSSRGGQTKNPYVLDRNPCGSSSGSGVAVAANLCAFAIGTETNGSISCPASINGIVGLKPTVGLVSQRGIIPISMTQDTAGPMTRTVRDAAIVLAAISDKDEEATRSSANLPDTYLAALSTGYLRGKRIGVEKSFLKVHEKIDVLLQHAIAQMQEQGATVVEVEFTKRLEPIQNNESKLLQYEFKDGLNKYLAGVAEGARSLKEVIEWNKAHAETAMPYFQQELLEASEDRGTLDDEEYKKALDIVVNTSRRAIDATLKENRLDAICGPATGAAWCTDLVNGDAYSGYGMGSGAAMAGYPSLTIPMGQIYGLPVGLLFMASAWSETTLLGIGYHYEQISRNRHAPTFIKSIL